MMNEILAAWRWNGSVSEPVPYGEGHINQTYAITVTSEQGAKRYILQKISVIFHALQRQPYAARKEVFRDFLTSGLAARKAELPLCGCYFHLVCRLLAAHRYRLAHLLLKTRNI